MITHNAKLGQFVQGSIPKGAGNLINFINPPLWFFWSGNTSGSTTVNYQFTAPTIGTFVIDYTENEINPESENPQVGEGTITIEVAQQFELHEVCCDNPMNIAWLSPSGWQSYIFDGKSTYKIDIGDNLTFKDSDNILRYSERTNVRDAVTVTSGYVPKHHVDYTATLRYAIQAYLFNIQTNSWDIPIVINSDSFTKYQDKQKLFEISFEFVYANEIKVQEQ